MAQHHGELLRRFLLINEISPEKLALQMGKSKVTLYSWMKKPELNLVQLDELKKAGINLNIEHSLSAKESANQDLNKMASHQPNIIYVPLFAIAGFSAGYRDTIFMNSLDRFSLPGVVGEHFAFEISGFSMYKPGHELSASPGDIAISRIIDGPNYFIKGKGYILQSIGGIVYKIFEKIDDKKIHFQSLNEDYDGYNLIHKELKRAYFVDFILKKTK